MVSDTREIRQESVVAPTEPAGHPELRVLPEWPRDTIAVLVTAAPVLHAIPVSWPLRAGDKRVLLSLRHNRGSLARLRESAEVVLVILGGGNVALSARGTARVLAEPMPGAEDYVAVAIDIEVIDDHRQGAFLVDAGITRTVVDESEFQYLEARFATLREMARETE
ncbi:hypothetical protein ACWEKT_08855 [Nocardia takedensis]|uniref:hypothetical protein n=1 Tax=Nocardia takedensis TaxID=259390 RepID=UPI001FE1FD7D|nr:hypothetical protein [Nocardia takedensis]